MTFRATWIKFIERNPELSDGEGKALKTSEIKVLVRQFYEAGQKEGSESSDNRPKNFDNRQTSESVPNPFKDIFNKFNP